MNMDSLHFFILHLQFDLMDLKLMNELLRITLRRGLLQILCFRTKSLFRLGALVSLWRKTLVVFDFTVG